MMQFHEGKGRSPAPSGRNKAEGNSAMTRGSRRRHSFTFSRIVAITALVSGLADLPAFAQSDHYTFETVPVQPVALSPDGSQLFVLNVPDSQLEIFAVTPSGISHTGSVQVGMEPSAIGVVSSPRL